MPLLGPHLILISLLGAGAGVDVLLFDIIPREKSSMQFGAISVHETRSHFGANRRVGRDVNA